MLRASTEHKARLAEILAIGGMPVREIAQHIGVCERTVKKLRCSDAARQERANILKKLSDLIVQIRIERLREYSPSPREKRMQEDVARMRQFLVEIRSRVKHK